MKQLFYVDTCIWLNLFKKEGDSSKGVPYWKIAHRFLDKVLFSSDAEIVYSEVILKELHYKIESESLWLQVSSFFTEEKNCRKVEASKEDYDFARKLEAQCAYALSFFDCLHIAIGKRCNCVLVTRDAVLIAVARGIISVEKPENLLL